MSQEKEAIYYLGVDYGKSKIGLALADSKMRIASAFKTLDNNKDFLDKLAKIIKENSIEKIIFGATSFNDQKDNKKRAGELIEQKLQIPVEFQNEMFTTKLAQANLIEKGVKGIKKFDDQEAARIILQSWLDKK